MPRGGYRAPKVAQTTMRDKILRYMAEYACENHNSPVPETIARHFNRARNTIITHLDKLLSENRIIRTDDGRYKIVNAEYIPPDF